MKAETKFNVGDLVSCIYDHDPDDARQALKIMEVYIQICYTTSQIFYYTKRIVAMRKEGRFNYETKETSFEWIVGHDISKDDNSTGWRKYREDELIECSEETKNIILNPPKGSKKLNSYMNSRK